MVIRSARFNTYLLAGALAALLVGCTSTATKRDREIAMLRLHIEVNRDAGDRSEPVAISRASRIMVNVNKDPFLSEAFVTKAGIVEAMGGFTLSIEFDHSGTLLLEQYTATNPGKHIAIAAHWGEKQQEIRWLAAPLIIRRIGDGRLNFTPDATRAEAEEIARGLNNGAIQNGNQEKPKTTKSEPE